MLDKVSKRLNALCIRDVECICKKGDTVRIDIEFYDKGDVLCKEYTVFNRKTLVQEVIPAVWAKGDEVYRIIIIINEEECYDAHVLSNLYGPKEGLLQNFFEVVK